MIQLMRVTENCSSEAQTADCGAVKVLFRAGVKPRLRAIGILECDRHADRAELSLANEIQ